VVVVVGVLHCKVAPSNAMQKVKEQKGKKEQEKEKGKKEEKQK
jgi:hypothetical protein